MKRAWPALMILLASGCWVPNPENRDGKFLNEVVNLEAFNSEYDDYNSNLPQNRYGEMQLVFSSKRDRKDVFNLVNAPAYFHYDKGLELRKGTQNGGGDYYMRYVAAGLLVDKANGPFNVYGPRLLSLRYDFSSYGTAPDELALFYADDAAGQMDIKCVRGNAPQPLVLQYLNSPANDAYPTFSPYGEVVYFCSDRDGNFDIYEARIPREQRDTVTLESLVNPKRYELKKVEALSSPYNDKCPYLSDNKMVFVSDRPGGLGSEDIYYSEYKNGKWSEPVNAGARINTAYNEYRPILPWLPNFSYDLMIFSSNRPGGKGGYDLYMTGLKDRR